MINQVSILGNLATAPRQEVLPSGTVKVSFLLAYNSYYTDRSGQQQEKAEFFWVETFGRSAVNASKFLVQGQQVAVAGQLSGGNIRLEGSPKQVRMNYSDVQNTRWLQYGYPTF
jgi:single stranded DNA-binding protein